MIISCEILFREICYCASQSKHIVDVSFLSKGLHDIGTKSMLSQLQEKIDSIDTTKYEAILLGYGLCNNGIIGLKSSIPIIIPRAHDCITLLLGSKEKYKEYHSLNSATFYKSTGWIERDSNPNDTENSVTSQIGMSKSYSDYVEQYGEENAKFLMETMGDWLSNYDKYAFVDTKIVCNDSYKEITKKLAQKK